MTSPVGKGGDPATRVTVRAAGGRADYPVLVGTGVLDALVRVLEERAPAHRYAVITDTNVEAPWGRPVAERLREAGLRTDLHAFPAGERHKTRESWAALTDALLGAGCGRDTAVVAVGGGVTGDLAGFVAATFLRGVPVVQVPTSLVAMIDASVGGKTGVDAPTGKNLVGAFHPPRAVVADPATIGTLPRVERAQGLAEAVKHGAILDREYLEALHRDAGRLLDAEPGALHRAVVRSVELKGDVVSRDERESGLREILNFGHTLGHALEAASDYALPHGSAVALGMVLEARLGEALGVTGQGTADALAGTLSAFGLPVPGGAAGAGSGHAFDVDVVLRFTRADKKARGGRPRYVLLEAPGRVARDGDRWSRAVEDGAVEAVLADAQPILG